MAPAYGEADFYALQAAGLAVLVDPVDAEARFTAAVPEVAGMRVKEADPVLLRLLDERGALVQSGRIVHSYPFCWRTGTPLIYKAIPTWFVRVEALRDRMVELNRTVHWVPSFVGERRFGNWLAQARDWAISRNRYWGSCLPVWECPSCRHQVCVGSIEELFALSGVRLTDLHKHVVDRVTFPCPECGETMNRVPEVLDVWFESGSMPYAQHHYPFEDPEAFARRFPADYIAEGLDQTRGWFYTLLVLSTALFDQAPFRNCVVNGLILAEDGRKMSKSLKNYPDPFALMESTGADALRAYLINSPVVRAEPLRFSEDGVREVVRTVMLPLWNAFSFFTTYAAADGLGAADLAAAPPPAARPEIDRWILSVLQSLIARVNHEMEGYFLYDVVPPLIAFVDDLTNWYIRRSRRRFWRQRDAGSAATAADTLAAFATLYEVLVRLCQGDGPGAPLHHRDPLPGTGGGARPRPAPPAAAASTTATTPKPTRASSTPASRPTWPWCAPWSAWAGACAGPTPSGCASRCPPSPWSATTPAVRGRGRRPRRPHRRGAQRQGGGHQRGRAGPRPPERQAQLPPPRPAPRRPHEGGGGGDRGPGRGRGGRPAGRRDAHRSPARRSPSTTSSSPAPPGPGWWWPPPSGWPWPSTPPSPRNWPGRAWPARWSRRSRPCAAPPGSRSPTASPSPGRRTSAAVVEATGRARRLDRRRGPGGRSASAASPGRGERRGRRRPRRLGRGGPALGATGPALSRDTWASRFRPRMRTSGDRSTATDPMRTGGIRARSGASSGWVTRRRTWRTRPTGCSSPTGTHSRTHAGEAPRWCSARRTEQTMPTG